MCGARLLLPKVHLCFAVSIHKGNARLFIFRPGRRARLNRGGEPPPRGSRFAAALGFGAVKVAAATVSAELIIAAFHAQLS